MIKTNSKNLEEYNELAKTAFDAEDFQTAIDLFTKCIDLQKELGEDFSFSLVSRGIAFIGIANFTLALSDFDEALAIDDNNGWFYDSRAVLKFHMGDFEGAIADFDQAIRCEPEEASYREKRAECLKSFKTKPQPKI